MSNNAEIVFKYNNYCVVKKLITEDGDEHMGYAVQNIETGVDEITSTILPSMISVAKEMSDHLDDLLKEESAEVLAFTREQ